MERLEKIFPNEREAKIAQGLLQTLLELEQPALALRVTESAQGNIATLIKGTDVKSKKVDYNEMFMVLLENGYVEVGSLNHAFCMSLGPNSLLTMPEEASKFFQENYIQK